MTSAPEDFRFGIELEVKFRSKDEKRHPLGYKWQAATERITTALKKAGFDHERYRTAMGLDYRKWVLMPEGSIRVLSPVPEIPEICECKCNLGERDANHF
jgi:hypothetical protein